MKRKVHFMIEPNYQSYSCSHQVVSFCGRHFDKSCKKDKERLTETVEKVTCKRCLKLLGGNNG